MKNNFLNCIDSRLEILKRLKNIDFYIKDLIENACSVIKDKKKFFFCGNGGSAAESIHLNAEMIGKFKLLRRPVSSICLNTDIAVITALSNDFGFENLFIRQIEALANEGDMIFFLTTSGKSKNIIKALKFAKKNKLITTTLCGKYTKSLKNYSDHIISIDSFDTAIIQEMHLFIGHYICEQIEKNL